jgi:hypothetical protein
LRGEPDLVRYSESRRALKIELAICTVEEIGRSKMVDRVYKSQIPALRKALEKLRANFSNLSPKTNWTKLRIEPLLKHVNRLEQLLVSGEFSREFSRLRRGVELFWSDLEYLRRNVRGLERVLQSEKRLLGRIRKNKGS